MKKLVVLPVILILAAGLCFAEVNESAPEIREIERFDLEIYAGFPVHWTNAEHGQGFYWFNPNYTMEDKTVTANTAIGLSMTYNINKYVGINLDTDFFYGAKLAGFSNPSSDYISMFGSNIVIGPMFYLYNNNLLRIPMTVGCHFYYYSDDLWMPSLIGYDPQNPITQSTAGFWTKRRDFQLGPVISLGIQYHFNESIYIFSRTNVSVDFFRWHQISYIADDGTGNGTYTSRTKAETEFAVSWGVKPAMGIGIKF
jgi:hypothetical protein